MGPVDDDSKGNILSAARVRKLEDASVEEIDRCTQLFLDGLGDLPTLYLQGGSSPWDGSRQSVLWAWMRDKVEVACETGDILVVGPKPSLSGFERREMKSRIERWSGPSEGGITGAEGIWGVAHRALPGSIPWEKNGIVTCGEYDRRLTANEIVLRNTANISASELKSHLMVSAESSIKESTFLNLLATDSRCRGLGLGKKLFDTVAEEARQRESEMTWFTQTERNEQMYERWGGECLDKQKLCIPGLSMSDESSQTWRVFVKRV